MLRYILLIGLIAVIAFFTIDVENSTPASPQPLSTGVGFTPEQIILKEVTGEDLKELVGEDLIFTDKNGVKWVAPKGTLTDGASVPRLALPITNGRFAKEFLKASIIHDAYSQTENATRTPGQYRKEPWESVHRMFYEAMIAGGTTETTALIMYAAVLLGGPRWDDPKRDLMKVPNNQLQTLFDKCEKFIKAGNVSVQDLEKWMKKQEAAVLSDIR